MEYKFKKSVLAASIAITCAMSPSAYATNGYAAHGFGTVQKAMGGTAVAGSDNAMNIATNPASMSFGKNNWTAGVDIFAPDRGASYESPTPNPAIPGATLDGNDDSNFVIPEFAYQRHLNEKFAVGVAVFGNGGMNATYDRPIFDTDPTRQTGIDFAQLFVAPSLSMKINKNQSIGASLNLVYQRIKINGVGSFAPFSTDPTSLTNNGYDSSTGAGVTLGWQGKVNDQLTLGLAYRSETKMSEFDDYRGLLAEQGDFDIPSMVTAGLSYKATPKTTVAVDLARINYTDVAAISNKNNTAPLQGQLLGGTLPQNLVGPKLGDDEGAGFGWRDQTVVKIGVKHQLNNKLTLLAGYNHGKSPIPETETAFNVLAPATVEDHVTLGMEYQLSKSSNIAFQYMHAFDNTIKGDGTLTATGPASPGSIIQVGPSPFTDITAADINMSQDSFGIAYSKNF
jgi:long-chain fatty acid transport protein